MATLVQDAAENIFVCEVGSGYFVLSFSLKLKIVDCRLLQPAMCVISHEIDHAFKAGEGGGGGAGGAKYLGPGLVSGPDILVKRLVMGATVLRGQAPVMCNDFLVQGPEPGSRQPCMLYMDLLMIIVQ